MNRNVMIMAGSVVTTLILVAYFGSAFFAVHRLTVAARSGDRDRLEQWVDFPAVRLALKEQLSAEMLKSLTSDAGMKDNPFAALGILLVPTIIDKMVDAFATPEGIATLVVTAKAPDPESVEHPPLQAKESSRRNLETHYSYVGLDRFRAYLEDKDHETGELGLIFERRGLFGWKLIRIDLPLETMKQHQDIAGPEADSELAQSSLSKVGDCDHTRIAQIGSRLEGVPDSGSSIQYENGKYQVSYDLVPEIFNSQVGDDMELCVVQLPTNCPPGDMRGIVYKAVNMRTGGTWTEADSSHSCGGA